MFFDLALISLQNVAIAAAVSFVVGFFWFSPLAFGELWARHVPHSHKEGGANMLPFLIGAYGAAFFNAYGLAWVLELAKTFTSMTAVQTSLVISATFLIPRIFSDMLWHGKKFEVFLIESAGAVVNFVAMALFYAWMYGA